MFPEQNKGEGKEHHRPTQHQHQQQKGKIYKYTVENNEFH